ncbi:U20-hexatoxin-Hi1a [Parasteatoda tepidariorum]|uniref:U20-hexatoxin-Hi1a n=1 Tax=Parasteatoda tepidariorum TaxID=114398 RepID=UPI0039BCC17B
MQQNMFLVLFLALFSYAFAGAIDTRRETTCQTHKRNSGGNRALMRWDIRCDAQGLYMPLQCTEDTPKWCACYNKEEAITQPSRGTKSCECHLARDIAMKNSALPCDVPKCDRSGKYHKKQCCETTRKCHCVDAVTGQKKTQPTSDTNLVC